MSLLVLDDVKVHYGGVRAVDGVSFSVEPGQLCGMVGPNGSGKTTTINAITRTAKLTSGRITFDGTDIANVPPFKLRRIGLVRTFQGIRLIPDLTVRDNIRLAAEQHGHKRRKSRAGAVTPDAFSEALIERFGLSDVKNERPGALPYGTQRRVEIVRALSTSPKLLLLDEPVAGMNHAERADIANVLKELHAEGLSMLIIEHDLRMLLNLSDHLVVLNFGKLLAEGEPHATASLPDVQRAYLGGSIERD
ncbi:MAG: ABC-type branched-chain amino acid transport system ATPase component [Subtercola sp.]|nr:ABC-type branched-chain amino acid transport system ATPase component [Subtercola sp.]